VVLPSTAFPACNGLTRIHFSRLVL